VTAEKNAYRNLYLSHLVMYSKGQIDSSKALHFDGAKSSNPSIYYLQSPSKAIFPNTGVEMERPTWVNSMTGVTRHISEDGDIYLTDGSVGSHRFSQANVRVISNDPNASLYLKNLLVPTSGDLENFHHRVVVYHSDGYNPQKETGTDNNSVVFTLVTGQDIINVCNQEQFSRIENPESFSKDQGVVVFITGKLSLSQLREAILTATDYVHLRDGSLPLDASVIQHKSGKNALVFDPSQSLTQGRIQTGLFSSGNSVWKEDYLYRSFNGITHSNLNIPRRYGDIVERLNNQTLITQPSQIKELYTKAPDALLFFLQDKKGKSPVISKGKADDALKLWHEGLIDGTQVSPFYRGNRPLIEPVQGALVQAFQAFLTKYPNLPVYAINRSEKLDQVLDSVFDSKQSDFPSLDVNKLKK